MRKFEDSIPLQLLKAREASMQFFRPLLQKNNLTEQQWRVLRALKANDELESKQLADLCCILSPSLTGIIKRLEQQGFIERRKSAEDQRRTLIKLTEQALQLFEQISPEVDAHYQLFAERFGEDKLEQLSKLLQELASIKP
ncbi:homoprotocatechuate degradation operon regulator HpaR [Neptunomonas japonica]|uniref:MarR family transcriptional regulator n=1 Tax=Neptunomonas japonica JAMM 1380 TaxID=1441457 RepID=A0A7R6P9U4_9GAMM|nr:homoprotocatechuate degradation operon regulator HpaR [Neptunomonas japonica]BBB29899.1 MarR family transcriptional regulator [Neptunomonas japonica JAMM 1380]